MIFSEKNSNIASALAKAWGCVSTPKHNSKVVVKTKGGGSYSFDYTDLTGIFDAVRDVYKSHDIAIIQNSYTEPSPSGNQQLVCVETMLLHSSGEYIKSFPLKFQAATSMQDLGGQITYMKRYSLSSLLGLSTDKDDDANGYSGNDYSQQQKRSQRQQPQRQQPQQQQQPQQRQQPQQQQQPQQRQQPQQQQQPQQRQQPQQQQPQQRKSGSDKKTENLMMPINLEQAVSLTIPSGEYAGKTLKEVWKENIKFIQFMYQSESIPLNYKKAIEFMMQADAESKAKQKMQQDTPEQK